jgi:hypothetical protein
VLSSFFRASDGTVHPVTYHPSIKQVHGRVVGEE